MATFGKDLPLLVKQCKMTLPYGSMADVVELMSRCGKQQE
jgi:hypothetical protein